MPKKPSLSASLYGFSYGSWLLERRNGSVWAVLAGQ